MLSLDIHIGAIFSSAWSWCRLPEQKNTVLDEKKANVVISNKLLIIKCLTQLEKHLPSFFLKGQKSLITVALWVVSVKIRDFQYLKVFSWKPSIYFFSESKNTFRKWSRPQSFPTVLPCSQTQSLKLYSRCKFPTKTWVWCRTFIFNLSHPMLLLWAPPAVTGISGIFEDLEWFPEGRPLVDSVDVGSRKETLHWLVWLSRETCSISHNTFHFIFGRTRTVIYLLASWRKKKKWSGPSSVQKYTCF